MIRSRGHASTATAAIFLLALGACSPEASSPRQNSTDTAVPSRTQAPSTTAGVTSSPSTAPLAARRAPTPLRAVHPSDLVVRVDSLGELCCPAPVVVAGPAAVRGSVLQAVACADTVGRARGPSHRAGLLAPCDCLGGRGAAALRRRRVSGRELSGAGGWVAARRRCHRLAIHHVYCRLRRAPRGDESSLRPDRPRDPAAPVRGA